MSHLDPGYIHLHIVFSASCIVLEVFMGLTASVWSVRSALDIFIFGIGLGLNIIPVLTPSQVTMQSSQP